MKFNPNDPAFPVLNAKHVSEEVLKAFAAGQTHTIQVYNNRSTDFKDVRDYLNTLGLIPSPENKEQ